MRLFVALDIPEETRETLAKYIREFAKACRGANWVRAEILHITLKFIGETEEAQLPAIQKSLAEVKAREAIEIVFRHFGFFPNERHPRVFWAGMEAGPSLAELAKRIDEKLAPLDIPRETRDFRPHLTLARFKSIEGLPKLRDMIAGLTTQELGRVVAREFHLYRSNLKRSGAEHLRLATFPFSGGGE